MKEIGDNRNRTEYCRKRPGAASLLRSFLTGAAMSLAWGILSALLHLPDQFPDSAAAQLFSQPLPVQTALYGLVSPVLEELFFRLLLFDLVKKAVPGTAAAVIVCALFAMWHGNVIQMLYAFPAGLILQHLRTEYGRIGESIVCHIGANITAIVVAGC